MPLALVASLLCGSAVLLGMAVSDRVPSPLARPAAPRPLTYVALGASDSVGVGADRPEAESWVAVLHRRLPEGTRLVNVGVSGSLLRQALEQQLPVAIDSHPDVVTVWLAVNDLNARVPLDRYGAELDSMLGSLRHETSATILVANIPDLAPLPVYQQQRLEPEVVRAEVRRWNEVIAQVAGRHRAILVDLHAGGYELAGHPEYIARDGFHPSTEGYRRIADVFLNVLVDQTDVL